MLLLLAIALPGLVAQEKKKDATKAKPAAKKEEKQKPDDPYIAFVGGRVHPVSGPVIRDGTVLIKGGKIVEVGRDVALPRGTRKIDVTGRHVVPGFVAIAASGSLGVRGGGRGSEKSKDRFDPFSQLMEMALSTGITTAHEGPRGGGNFRFFRGRGGGAFSGSAKGTLGGVIGKLTHGTIEGFEVREPAAVYMTLGSQGTERLELRDALRKAREYVAKHDAWVKALIELKKDAKRPDKPKTDKGTEALARCMRGELPLFITANKRSEIQACLALCRKYKVPMVIEGGMEAWTVVSEVGRCPVSMIICPRGRPGRATRPYKSKWVDAPHGWTLENAAILSRTGVPWATRTLSTSISTSGTAGRDLLWLPMEAAFAVRGGATNEEALRSITLSAAEMLRIDDRVGSLEVGKDADLLVMDREPLDYRSLVLEAWVNGRLAYDKKRSTLWSHIPTDRSQRPEGFAPWGIWSRPRARGSKGPERRSSR